MRYLKRLFVEWLTKDEQTIHVIGKDNLIILVTDTYISSEVAARVRADFDSAIRDDGRKVAIIDGSLKNVRIFEVAR